MRLDEVLRDLGSEASPAPNWICAWCQKPMGHNPDVEGLTHGICRDCKDQIDAQLKEDLLRESAKQPEDLPDGVFVAFDSSSDATRWLIFFSDENGKASRVLRGRIEILPMYEDRGPMSFMVRSSGATHGWGPLLYDLAMEMAGKGGLRPDGQVSDSARAVWKHYREQRPDVRVEQRLDQWGQPYEVFIKDNEDVRDTIYRMGRLVEKDTF